MEQNKVSLKKKVTLKEKPEREGRWKRHCELLSELSSMLEKYSLLHEEYLALLNCNSEHV